jgi:UDP-glucose:(heptosyl)LPS alpha-1,3-glucosyltransferase
MPADRIRASLDLNRAAPKRRFQLLRRLRGAAERSQEQPVVAIVARKVTGTTGTSRTILSHARLLADAGWRVAIVAETAPPELAAAAGADLVRVPRLPVGNWWKRRAFSAFAGFCGRRAGGVVWGHGDDLQPDLLSLHNCVHRAHELVRGRPIDPSDAVARFFERLFAVGAFRRLIANSQRMADDVQSRFGVPADRIAVVHPGYDPARFGATGRERNRAALRERLQLPPDRPLLGFVTSGDFEKRGATTFLRTLAALPGEVHGLLVGREASFAPWQQEAAALGIAGRVTFEAPCLDVAALYHGLDVLVHPAAYEEFGQVVQEAGVCGTALVTSRRVGASERLVGLDLAERFVLETPDPERLAAAALPLLRDPSLRLRWAEVARQRYLPNTVAANFAASLPVLEAVRTELAAGAPRSPSR